MSTAPRNMPVRIALLDDLEAETSYLRDLIYLIADNLNDVYQGQLTSGDKHHVRMATTLAIVARDRVDAAYARMNATYGIEGAE